MLPKWVAVIRKKVVENDYEELTTLVDDRLRLVMSLEHAIEVLEEIREQSEGIPQQKAEHALKTIANVPQ